MRQAIIAIFATVLLAASNAVSAQLPKAESVDTSVHSRSTIGVQTDIVAKRSLRTIDPLDDSDDDDYKDH